MIYQFNKKESNIFGLKYIPVPLNVSPNDDHGDWGDKEDVSGYNGNDVHFTPCSVNSLFQALEKVENMKSILEIGLHNPTRPTEVSSTNILHLVKKKDCVYIGVDIADRMFLQKPEDNIHIIKGDSLNFTLVYSKMSEVGIDSFDFIFIDGWHSINQTIGEWKNYVTKLNVGGMVGFHDTNFHPGPRLLFDAIDEEYFNKTKFCVSSNEFGISFAQRIK